MVARMPAPITRRIAIIGSGFSGLCLGIRLKQAGIDSFTIYEKSDGLGGTWRDNVYPGAACDVPSFAYCFSFEQKTDWSRKWSPQQEILDYMDACAAKYGIVPHIRFGTEIAAARFDEAAGVWRLRTTRGDEIEADVLVSGVGQLNRPSVPSIPGLEAFRGERFHSARWNHAYDLADKRVAVVGNAASAIQFIPQIAPKVRRLFVLQRSPNWMLPRGDRAYSDAEKRRFTRHPWLARLYRWWIWLQHEMRFPVFRRSRMLTAVVEREARRHVEDTVADPALRAVLIPDYPVGGKRLLISDDYYQALGRGNVELVTAGIDRVEADAIVLRDGRRLEIDALILATGFESTSFLAPMAIEGRGGRALADEWAHGARAYLGLTAAGFPNFFMMYGPNTNLGHNSIIFMIECQAQYVMDCLAQMDARGLAWIDLRPDAMERYNADVQRELAATVWAATDRSWYKTADGTITNNWPGTTTRYWWATRHADLACYETAVRTAAGATRDRPAAAA
jgi:cation diffusion facilitator CzcD-associated flavoprotein CzcO